MTEIHYYNTMIFCSKTWIQPCTYFSHHPCPTHTYTPHTHNTHTLFYNKIAQEQKSSKTAVCYSNHFFFYNLQLTGRSDIYKKWWLWNVCHETESFINTPDKKKVRVHFSWPEWRLYITFGGSKPRQNEYYQVVMVTKLWLVPSNISLPSQGSCLQSTVRQGLRSIWDSPGTFTNNTAAAAKSLQSCPTLCDPIDGSPPAPPSLGFSRQEHWSGLPFPSPMHEGEKRKVKSLSCVRLLATPWTAAYQAPPFMGFSRQEYWSGVPLPSPKQLYIGDQFIVHRVGRTLCLQTFFELVLLSASHAKNKAHRSRVAATFQESSAAEHRRLSRTNSQPCDTPT